MLVRWIGLTGAAALVLAAALTNAAAEEIKTDMSKGGITFSSGNNSLTIGARAQFRYTGDDREGYDADTSGTGVGEEDGWSHQFAVQRMRLILKGGMFRPWLKYEFQFELSNTSGDKDNKVKDAVIEIDKNPLLVLKMGQFKSPFSLQELTSSGRQQFVDRAITNAKFAPGRDQGFMLWGATEKKFFGYSAGVFNGGGEAKAQDDQGLMYVARVWIDPFGEYKLAESANDAPEKGILHAGLGLRAGEAIKGAPTPGVFEDPDDEIAYNLELAWKWRRWFATGEYFMMTDEVTDRDPNSPTYLSSLPDVDSKGWHAQVGFMVVPKTAEVALRYATVDPDEDVADDGVSEARAAFGWYFQGHNLKVQADYGQVKFSEGFTAYGSSSFPVRNMPSLDFSRRLGGAKDYTDQQVRVQVQVAF